MSAVTGSPLDVDFWKARLGQTVRLPPRAMRPPTEIGFTTIPISPAQHNSTGAEGDRSVKHADAGMGLVQCGAASAEVIITRPKLPKSPLPSTTDSSG